MYMCMLTIKKPMTLMVSIHCSCYEKIGWEGEPAPPGKVYRALRSAVPEGPTGAAPSHCDTGSNRE